MKFKTHFFWLLAGLACFAAPAAWADVSPSIEISVSESRVPIGGQITMDLVISNAPGKISNPSLGNVDGFMAYSQGHSQEISIVNGQMSSRSIFSYVLVANATGKKTIGPFDVVIEGRTYKVAPVQVEVVPDASRQAPPQPGASVAPPSRGPSAAPPSPGPPGSALPPGMSDKDVFIQAWTDKDEVYVNEPVTLAYTFYQRVPADPRGFDKDPVLTGFWSEDLPPQKVAKRREKIIEGSRYLVTDIRKIVLFPIEAGAFTLDPGSIDVNVQVRQNDFLSQIVAKKMALDPIPVTVKMLPAEGKPAGFGGAVGNYLMEGSVDKNTVEAGDPITYRLRVWGRGNISTLTMPSLPKPEGFKVYDSSSSTNVTKDKLVVEGEKITETVMVPKKPGTYTIPPVSFSYFDLDEKTYRVMKTDPQVITVTGSAVAEDESPTTSFAAADEPGGRGQDVSVLAKDIRFLRTSAAPRALSGYDLYGNPVYWIFAALFFAGWLAFSFLASAPKIDGAAGLRDLKFRRSHAIARQKLKEAKRMLREEKQEEFYTETSKAVYGYFGDKLGISPQSVSLPVIEARAGEELGSELFNQIKKLFDDLSAGRFAKSAKTKEEMHDLYALADRVITFFERVKMK